MGVPVQKEFYFDFEPECNLWDGVWTTRTIEQELDACDLETPARDLFLTYIPRGGRIIDGGCGFGKWVIYLKQRGYDIVGIDNNEIAIAKLKDFDGSLQVELGDILNIHYPDHSFDAYISMGVIEHFEEGPGQALKEAHRVLKPSGLIFVSVPTLNIMRTVIRRPCRILINALYLSLMMLKLNWRKSKRGAFLAAMGAMKNILPERVLRIVYRRKRRYYHFLEYRYSRSELERFLKRAGFEIIKTVPHDLYGTNGHAAGLAVDFPFLAAPNGVNFRLNRSGTLISQMLLKISPRVACSSVLCVARVIKDNPQF
jgi:SAM-dependent methyltransferase